MVTVKSGINEITTSSAVGMSVASLKNTYTDALSIPEDARVLVNGETSPDGYISEDGDEVEFVKAAGEKGVVVKSGINELDSDNYNNLSIGTIRHRVADVLSIPDDARILLNGEPADSDTIVDDDDNVEFVKAAGEKG